MKYICNKPFGRADFSLTCRFLFMLKVFKGNRDRNSIVKRTFNPPIVARYIRLRPTEWKGRISLRMEIYGYFLGYDCNITLNMETFILKNINLNMEALILTNINLNTEAFIPVFEGCTCVKPS